MKGGNIIEGLSCSNESALGLPSISFLQVGQLWWSSSQVQRHPSQNLWPQGISRTMVSSDFWENSSQQTGHFSSCIPAILKCFASFFFKPWIASSVAPTGTFPEFRPSNPGIMNWNPKSKGEGSMKVNVLVTLTKGSSDHLLGSWGLLFSWGLSCLCWTGVCGLYATYGSNSSHFHQLRSQHKDFCIFDKRHLDSPNRASWTHVCIDGNRNFVV